MIATCVDLSSINLTMSSLPIVLGPAGASPIESECSPLACTERGTVRELSGCNDAHQR